MGEKHGSANSAGWYVVSDTFAFRWETREMACRLIVRPKFEAKQIDHRPTQR